MRIVRTFQFNGGIRLTAYENKVKWLNIKLEVPTKGHSGNITYVVPMNVNDKKLCALFDDFLATAKNLKLNQIREAFVKRFISNHAVY